MSRKKLAWANKEVETFVCILAEEDVVYDVYVAAAAIDIRPTTKGTVGGGNATSELSWAIPPPPYRPFAIPSVPHLQWKRGISHHAAGLKVWCDGQTLKVWNISLTGKERFIFTKNIHIHL